MAAPARRGPAPIASFDHDVSDESSPETKQTFQLPEIRESGIGGAGAGERPSSAGSAGAAGAGALATPAAPRIDISRASSSSHHDSRDSSPELALFAGAGDEARGALHLAFREEGAAELRSSTEELAFLDAPAAPAPPPAPPAPPASASACASRRHSRKDSQGSEAALLAVSGRTSRVSSVGSHCSALSGLSRVSRLSAVSGASRSPSPHKMLLETSFCGPKPIETDPEICAAAVEERLLEMVKMSAPADERDRRRVHTAATVEPAPRPAAPPPVPRPAPLAPDADKTEKENRNRARVEERRARSRERRDPSQPEVYKPRNKSKDIIRIKLKPNHEYDDDDDDDDDEEEVGPDSRPSRPTALHATPAAAPCALSPTPSRRSVSPAPGGGGVSRKSSFCSLFKSRETIGSPDSPSDAMRRKKSLTDGRSRSKSRDRSATPSSAGKLRGSVLSLFKNSKRAASPAPAAPPVEPAPPETLKYHHDGAAIIHIPLRTPPDEPPPYPHAAPAAPRPASAPPARPAARTVLPDGSIIIPLHSPTETAAPARVPSPEAPQRRVVAQVESTAATASPPEVACPAAPTSPPAARVAAAPTSPPAACVAVAPTSPPAATHPSPPATAPSPVEPERAQKRRERLIFTTHVGSTEQVFSTQFSITKTPSIASEISESVPSFQEEARGSDARDSSGRAIPATPATPAAAETAGAAAGGGWRGSPHGERSGRSSSSPECASPVRGEAGEERVLVVQDSLEEELPYVPTTLPQERPVALPMVPVSQRPKHRRSLASVERPRSGRAQSLSAPPPPPPAAPPPAADKLRIRLPRRDRDSGPAAAKPRARAGSAAADWVDFAEVAERRRPARRIQTLPAEARVYAAPEHCRCECHAAAQHPADPTQ